MRNTPEQRECEISGCRQLCRRDRENHHISEDVVVASASCDRWQELHSQSSDWCFTLEYQGSECGLAFTLFFFVCQTVESNKSLRIMKPHCCCWESLHRSAPPSQITGRSHACVLCFSGVFFPPLSLSVGAMNTQHQERCFYLHFKMSNSKRSVGERSRSAHH